MKKILQILAASIALTSTSHSFPVVLYQHNGATDPTAEAWTLGSHIGATTLGPVNDSGTPAWSIINSNAGDTGFYRAAPTPAEVSAASLGWSLKATLRVTDLDDAPGGSMLCLYRDGASSYQMHFGSTPSGDAVVVLTDNSSSDSTAGSRFTVPGGSIYNTFELIYSPTAGSADLFVNGVEQLSNYTGFPLAQTLLAWGDGSTRDQPLVPPRNYSDANYSEVVFSIVPEPSTAVFGVVGVLGLFLRRIRK